MSIREKFKNKRSKTVNEFRQWKSNANRLSFQQIQKEATPKSSSATAYKNKGCIIIRTSELNRLILRVACHKGIVSLLHAPGVVK